jgi:hypothetical protein
MVVGRIWGSKSFDENRNLIVADSFALTLPGHLPFPFSFSTLVVPTFFHPLPSTFARLFPSTPFISELPPIEASSIEQVLC